MLDAVLPATAFKWLDAMGDANLEPIGIARHGACCRARS